MPVQSDNLLPAGDVPQANGQVVAPADVASSRRGGSAVRREGDGPHRGFVPVEGQRLHIAARVPDADSAVQTGRQHPRLALGRRDCHRQDGHRMPVALGDLAHQAQRDRQRRSGFDHEARREHRSFRLRICKPEQVVAGRQLPREPAGCLDPLFFVAVDQEQRGRLVQFQRHLDRGRGGWLSRPRQKPARQPHPAGERAAAGHVQPAPAGQAALLHLRQYLDNLGSGGGALLGFLRQQPHDQPRQVGGNARLDLRRRLRLLGGDLKEDGANVRPVEGRPAGRHPVEHAAEAEQVGAQGHRAAFRLLGGHVRRRADNRSLPGRPLVVQRLGQAEVENLDPADPFTPNPSPTKRRGERRTSAPPLSPWWERGHGEGIRGRCWRA